MRSVFQAKRLFLAVGACLALSAITPAFAQTIELKVSHYLPPNHTVNVELLRWAADLEKKSNGRLKLSVFSSGQMGPITRQYDLARTGVADIAFFLHGATPGRFPMTELTQLPYAFNPDSSPQKPLSAAESMSRSRISATRTDGRASRRCCRSCGGMASPRAGSRRRWV